MKFTFYYTIFNPVCSALDLYCGSDHAKEIEAPNTEAAKMFFEKMFENNLEKGASVCIKNIKQSEDSK